MLVMNFGIEQENAKIVVVQKLLQQKGKSQSMNLLIAVYFLLFQNI